MPEKYLIVITGPTASGKSALAVNLAKKLNADIISADSRQIYKELNIGTAKVTMEEMQGVNHHFISSHSIHDDYNAGLYEKEALQVIRNLHKQHNVVVLTGGTGLYIDAICKGINDHLPGLNKNVRDAVDKFANNHGTDALYKLYSELDEDGAAQIDSKNRERLIRAISACIQMGKPFYSVKESSPKQREFKIIYFILDVPRDELYSRINQRVDEMMESGLEHEARKLMPNRHLGALRTVGYSELFAHFEGEISLEKAIELIKRNTRRYAKRQLTWFNKYPDAHWVNPGEIDRIIQVLQAEIID